MENIPLEVATCQYKHETVWRPCFITASSTSKTVVKGDHYRIGQSSVSHSFHNSVGILTKISRGIACTVELEHTNNYATALGNVKIFHSLKMSDPSIADICQLIKN